MHHRSRAILPLLLLATFSNAAPQSTEEEAPTEVELAQLDSLMEAYTDSVESSYTYGTGAIILADGVATLAVPEGFKFLDADQSRSVIVDVWENPPAVAEDVLGMIFPADAGVLDHSFAFVVEYDPMGYVSDEDADDINYEEMMADLQKDDAEANEQRKAAGYGTLHLIGWAAQPFYDKDRKVLHWAKELQAEEADGNTLNYNVRVLGRQGVLILNAVAAMDDLATVQENIPAVLDMAKFNEGHTYAEFDSNVDEVAAWTVGGLVAGKVLAKAGILALILKNIKLVLIALAAAGGAIWKFVGGRKKEEPPATPQA